VEDGVMAGRIDLRSLGNPTDQRDLAAVGLREFPDLEENVLIEAAARLWSMDIVNEVGAYDGTLARSVALKRLTSELVGRFASAAISMTRREAQERGISRYQADLVIPPMVAAEVAVLKTLALRFIFSDARHRAHQARQRDRIHRVANWLLHAAPGGLDPLLVPAWHQAADDSGRMRVIIDQIASMTEGRLERMDKQNLGASAHLG
jgi:dGTPase